MNEKSAPEWKHACNLWIDPKTTAYVVDHCDHPLDQIIPAYIGTVPQQVASPAVGDVAALKADAARYRWLKHRDLPWSYTDHPKSMVVTRWHSGHAPDEIDAAIDAAMDKEPN